MEGDLWDEEKQNQKPPHHSRTYENVNTEFGHVGKMLR